MDSTVKVCLFSIFIGFASAQIDDACKAKFDGEFCDPTESTNTPITLAEGRTMPDAMNDCYDACFADKDLVEGLKCLAFTVRKTGFRPPVCYLLTSPCVLDSTEACLSSDPVSCASGPSDCTNYTPVDCDPVVAQDGDYALWQCQDSNRDDINPYIERPPEGTVCYQTCSSWLSAEDVADPQGQLVSTCEGGAWSPAKSTDATASDGQLFYPGFPDDGTTYPTPDAAVGAALPCGCQPLNVQWPYGPVADPATQVWYDPNREEAAEFICETTVNMANKDYMIVTTNTCVLYCDDHYVATATCLDGQWSGNPEWGFWCYEEPIAIA
eukprot:TRINITY_DN54_c0_g1_i1.p1 TRINITY_DN54_c0_g1~~TRINITY_DN54_c0_g1_i1.p1  ORF type:complete len:333 (+),score=53.47 TRINITY_DN54_c0_g1_i1:25-999(+)